jgi:flagellar basal-body rod modification protein FlgD
MILWHNKKITKGENYMQIGSTTSTTSALQNGGTIKSQSQQGQMGMNDFFKLMAAQLQYQDPMNPTDNTQFMGQIAQFGALQQLTSMTNSLNFSLASSVVGRNVEFSHMDAQTGQTITGIGVVSSVDVSGSSPACLINGNWQSISDITKILANNSTGTNTEASLGTQSISTPTNLAELANISQLSNLAEAAQLMGESSSNNQQNTQDSLYGESILNTPML